MMNLQVSGGQPLEGSLAIQGSFSASLALVSAAAATPDTVTLHGVPNVGAVTQQLDSLSALGRQVDITSDSIRIASGSMDPHIAAATPLPQAILLFLGPLIAGYGTCTLPLPGAAHTGPYPIDLHIKALRALGARVSISAGSIEVAGHHLRGCNICLDVPSFGATWTAVTAATRAVGRTRIVGASHSPELVDAVNLLNRMGARIVGAGTEVITVYGPTTLHAGVHEVMPDRIAAGFYIIAGLATGGAVEVTGVIPEHLRTVTASLAATGALVDVKGDRVVVQAPSSLKPLNIRTGFYPGFPSHLQPALCSLLLRADGTSIVTETVFAERMFHWEELQRMGAQVTRDGQTAIIRGRQQLSPARLHAVDPGAAIALYVAALMTPGNSVVAGADALLDWFHTPVEICRGLGAESEWLSPARTAV